VDAEESGRLIRLFEAVDTTGGEFAPNYNTAPTDPVRAVIQPRPAAAPGTLPPRRLGVLRWGLLPSWMKDRKPGKPLVNARVETVATKPAFRAALVRRRCIVPATGFYEWQRQPAGGGRPLPYFIRAAGGDLLPFAGIYEVWRDGAGERHSSCAILTTIAAPDIADLHDRAPVVVPPEHWDRWLDPAPAAVEQVSALLAEMSPAPLGTFAAYRVADAVGNVRNNEPGLLEPLPA
jgi:putative SOS response-associated peptidase YedK